MNDGLLFLTIVATIFQPINEIDVDHVTMPNVGMDRMQKFFAWGYSKAGFLECSIRGEGFF